MSKVERLSEGATVFTTGICMLLTISASDVRDHLSDREVSTALFLPAYIGSKAGELPQTLTVSQSSKYSLQYKKI